MRLLARILFLPISHLARRLPPRHGTQLLLELHRLLGIRTSVEATRLEGGIHPKHRLTDYHRFFFSRLKPGERVIDIGSGVGALAFDMAEHGRASVTAIELSKKNYELAVARFSHPHVTHVLGDVLRDLPDRQFDTAVMSNVLEHIDDRVGFLRAAQKRLGPKRWLLRIPRYDRDWTVPLMDELGVDWRLDTTHFIEYTPETFGREIAEASLRITHLESRWGEFWCEAVPV